MTEEITRFWLVPYSAINPWFCTANQRKLKLKTRYQCNVTIEN